jgi:hypothetical protein
MSYTLIRLYKNISQEDDQDRATRPAEQPSPARATRPTSIVSPDISPNERGVSLAGDGRLAGQGVITEVFSSLASSHSGKGEITAMVVDPFTLYCYWELNQAVAATYMLTICNISENASWQIPIDNPMGSMYVKIEATSPARGMTLADGPSYFQVAVGINLQTNEMTLSEATRPEKIFSPIALSNRVSVPPSAASNRLDQKWWSPQVGAVREPPLQPFAQERYGVVTVSSKIASRRLSGLVGAVREPPLQPSLFCISRK